MDFDEIDRLQMNDMSREVGGGVLCRGKRMERERGDTQLNAY